MDASVLNTTSYPSQMAMVNTASGGLLLWIVVMIIGCAVLVYAITSLENYSRTSKILNLIFKSMKYAIFGAGILTGIWGIWVICDILARFGSGINPIHIGLGIGGYIGCAIIGWVANKIYLRYVELQSRTKEQI
jgi:hypothetical protein